MKTIETVSQTLQKLGFECTEGIDHLYFLRGNEMVLVKSKPTITIRYHYHSSKHHFLRKKLFNFSQINNSVSQLKNIIGY